MSPAPECIGRNCFSSKNTIQDIAKRRCKISMFLTNNSPDLYALTLCIMFRKNNSFLAQLPEISANPNKNYGFHNFQAFANISGNIKFPESSQYYFQYNLGYIMPLE